MNERRISALVHGVIRITVPRELASSPARIRKVCNLSVLLFIPSFENASSKGFIFLIDVAWLALKVLETMFCESECNVIFH